MFPKLIVFCTLPTGQVQLNNSEFDSQQDQRMLELENGDFQLLADTKLREQKLLAKYFSNRYYRI